MYTLKKRGVLPNLCPGEELFSVPYEISEPKKVRHFRTEPKKVLPLGTGSVKQLFFLECSLDVSVVSTDW